MSLRQVDGPPGPPWDRPLQGRLDRVVVESELLADNPLGDPARRPLYVYNSPGADGSDGVPAVYVIQGFTGQIDMFKIWDRDTWQRTFDEHEKIFDQPDALGELDL